MTTKSPIALAHSSGLVSLVGAGPGDPELLTVRAVRALERADVILYDRLVPSTIVALAKPSSRREYVGKTRDETVCTQAAINARLVELARRNRYVVRLKGGDPLIFGRGGEEIEALIAANIPYEIIPGITAALGCAAYAGIPLTHRALAQQVTLVTGHQASAQGGPDWSTLVGRQQTVVFYMGVAKIATIERELLIHGRAADTPVALIENGCTPAQRVVVTSLGALTVTALNAAIKAPALIIIGDVAAFGDALQQLNHLALGAAA